MSEQSGLWQQIKDKPYCDPTRRMDFVLLFDVKDGNPNGDPDAGNLPRMDPSDRHGIVTDVCIKRKIRDYLATVLTRSIYIQSQDALNTLYFRAANQITDDEAKEAIESLLAELDPCDNDAYNQLIELSGKSEAEEDKGEKRRREFRDWLARIDVDGLEFDPESGTIRYLGEAKSKQDFQKLLSQDDFDPGPFKVEIGELAALLAKAKPQKSAKQRKAREAIKAKMCEIYDDIRLFGAVLTAGTNAGQIRGPMQLKFARSVEPILQQDAAITRCAITKESDRARKESEFGRKAWLSYAAYRQHGYFNAPLAQQTGVTREDLARFWESIAFMFPNSQSASKGEMATQDLIVFVHPNNRGSAPSHRLLGRVDVNSKNGLPPSLRFGENGDDDIDQVIKAKGIEICRPLKDLWGGI